MIIAPYLQLSIKIEVKVDETSKSSGCVSGRKRFKRIIDRVRVSSTDRTIIHDLKESIARSSDIWIANSQEMRTKTTNQPFEPDLKDCRSNDRVEQSNNCIVDIPERSYSDLRNEYEDDRNKNCQ